MWISFAEPFVVPLARPEERTSKKTHLCVPNLFIRSPRAAVRVRDPVVHAVQAQFAPGEIGSQPDRLACNAAAVEIVAPDEDAALTSASRPRREAGTPALRSNARARSPCPSEA